MTDLNKKQVLTIWLLIIFMIIIVISINFIIPNIEVLVIGAIPFLIILGIILTLITQFFFDPKRQCPRCDKEIPSIYTRTCAKCSLVLMKKCDKCGIYLNTYVEGKPIQYCRDCGNKLKMKIEQIEISDTLQSFLEQTAKVNFCPTCGSGLDELDNPNFCPLCGGKID